MVTRRAFLQTAFWFPPALVLGTGCTSTSPGATAKLDYGPLAPLGGTMTFRVTVYPRYDFLSGSPRGVSPSTTHMYFSLVNGLVALEPLDPQWVVTHLAANAILYYRPTTLIARVPQTAELSVPLKQLGDFEVRAGAGELHQTTVFSFTNIAQDNLYLRITTAGTQIQDAPFTFTPQPL